MDKKIFRIERICKSFGKNEALKDINLEIKKGEIFVLMGPSGSGKTTLLRIINGLEPPSKGSIIFQDRELSSLEKKEALRVRRKMGMVFQGGYVFNDTVFGNVSYGLRVRGTEKDEIDERVDSALDMVGLSQHKNRDAKSLSGGEKQRVNFAMAMVINPEVLILDEPTANLDPINEESIVDIIRKINNLGITVILSTHKQRIAIDLAHRIALIRNGEIEQVGTPDDIFQNPLSEFVAAFTRMKNIFSGTVKEMDEKERRIIVDVCGLNIEIPVGYARLEKDMREGQNIKIGIRPEEIMLIREDMPINPNHRNIYTGKISEIRPSGGAMLRLLVDLNGLNVIVDIPRPLERKMELFKGREVILSLNTRSIKVLKENQDH